MKQRKVDLMNNKYPKQFVGEIQKITLVSMPCFFCCPPIGGAADEEQKLTISASGRVTYTSKAYFPPSCPPISEGKWKKFKLFDEAAKHILDTIIEPFRNYEIRPYCTDVGSWQLTAYNADGEVFKFDGCLYPECFEKAEELSYMIRNLMNMPEVYAFDGQNGFNSRKYIYLSVEFSEGGKTYYYRTEDDTIERGDYVIVPVSNSDEKMVKVVDIEEFGEDELPMPIESVNLIIKKIES